MRIRKAVIADAADIAAIHVASWQAAYRGAMPDDFLDQLSVERRTAAWRTWLVDSAGDVLVCETDGRLAGFISFGPSRDEDAGKRTAEIYSIYLPPENWRKGYGRRLTEDALLRLKQGGFDEVTLWVLSQNHRAIGFYTRAGFQADGAEKTETLQRGIVLHEVRYRCSIRA